MFLVFSCKICICISIRECYIYIKCIARCMTCYLLIEIIYISAASECDLCSGTLCASAIKLNAVDGTYIIYIYGITHGSSSVHDFLVCCSLVHK